MLLALVAGLLSGIWSGAADASGSSSCSSFLDSEALTCIKQHSITAHECFVALCLLLATLQMVCATMVSALVHFTQTILLLPCFTQVSECPMD